MKPGFTDGREKRVRKGGQKKRALTKDLCQDRAVPRAHMPHNASAQSYVTALLCVSRPFPLSSQPLLRGFNFSFLAVLPGETRLQTFLLSLQWTENDSVLLQVYGDVGEGGQRRGITAIVL